MLWPVAHSYQLSAVEGGLVHHRLKPLHPSQKIKDREQGIIEITVIPNRELEAQLLWFGNDVEVLQPTQLRQQIAEKIAKQL